MADSGLFDFLQSPDMTLGLNLLAAGAPTTDPNQAGFGTRLAGAVQRTTDQQLKNQQAATALYAAKQKAALMNLGLQGLQSETGLTPQSPGAVLGPGGLAGAAPSQAQATAPGPGTVAAGSPGAVMGGGGVGGVATPVAAPMAPAPAGAPGGLFSQRGAALLNLANDRDITANVTAMQPTFEIHDGVLWKKDPVAQTMTPQGFALSKSTSADGKSVINMADGSTVVAPGGVAAFGAFEDRKNESSARNTLSRQPFIAAGGREVPQSVYDAVRGITPPEAGGPSAPAGGPTPAPVLRAPGMPVPPTPRGAVGMFDAGPDGTVDINRARAAIRSIPDVAGRNAATAALEQQIQAENAGARPMAGIAPVVPPAMPGTTPAPAIGGLPPPSPVVAASGGAAPAATPAPLLTGGVRTDFANAPGQGIGIGGGMKFGPAEQAAQGAAKSGAEEQAKLQAQAEANPQKFLADVYPKIAADAKATPAQITNLQNMLKLSQARTYSASPLVPGPLIGMVPKNMNENADSYEKSRAALLDTYGSPTDNARQNKAIAIPEYGVSQPAQEKAIRQELGQAYAKQITDQVIAPYTMRGVDGGPPATSAHSVLSRNLTPEVANTVAPILAMPKTPQRDAAIQAARKNPQAEAVLREAIKSGALQ